MKRLALSLLLLVGLAGCQMAYDTFSDAFRGSSPSEEEVDYYRRTGREP
jgi:hypothetical protein